MIRSATLLLLLSALPATALAEDCAARPASEAERQYFRTVQRAAQTLLPPAPAGWQIIGEREPTIRLLEPGALSCEDPSAGIANAFGRDYSRYSGEQWFAMELAARTAAQQRPETAAAKRLRELRAQGEAQAAQLNAIIARQDLAALERLQTQMDAIGQQADVAQAQVTREERAASHFQPDSFIHLQVNVNGGLSQEGSTCFGAAKKLVVKGATTAIQCLLRDEQRQTDDPSIENATALIGFGQVDAATIDASGDPDRIYIADRANPTGPYTAIRSLAVRINAAPATLDAFLAGTDWSGLARLIDR